MEATQPTDEENPRMKRFKRGLDPRGKPTEPIFLRPHQPEPSLSELEGGPQTNVKSSILRPTWGFRKQDSVISSPPHATDWSYHGITPPDFKDFVMGGSLSNNEQMGAQAFYSANAHFQGSLFKAKVWKLEAKKFEEAFKKMEIRCTEAEEREAKHGEEMEALSAEVVQLRVGKEKIIDEYMDSAEFGAIIGQHDKGLYSDYYTEGWNGALEAVSGRQLGFQIADYPTPYLPVVPMEEGDDEGYGEGGEDGDRILDPLNASPLRSPSAFTDPVSGSAAGDTDDV